MNQIYQELSERIRGYVEELNHVAQRATQSWTRGKANPEVQDVYLESVALNLHGFYSGIERISEMIARHVDHYVPEGETWHRDLLLQIETIHDFFLAFFLATLKNNKAPGGALSWRRRKKGGKGLLS